METVPLKKGASEVAPLTGRETRMRKRDAAYFFNFILAANLLMYMEAGAIPAMLIPLADSFGMSTGEQGMLGGIVFLSIAFGGPFAGERTCCCRDHEL